MFKLGLHLQKAGKQSWGTNVFLKTVLLLVGSVTSAPPDMLLSSCPRHFLPTHTITALSGKANNLEFKEEGNLINSRATTKYLLHSRFNQELMKSSEDQSCIPSTCPITDFIFILENSISGHQISLVCTAVDKRCPCS